MDDISLRTDFFRREIEFFVLVEEEETGHKYNSTNTMWIYDKEIKLELIRTSESFKPGLKYTAFVSISLLYKLITQLISFMQQLFFFPSFRLNSGLFDLLSERKLVVEQRAIFHSVLNVMQIYLLNLNKVLVST